mmetsp:Transcript_24518/g.81505  ORF Transcript_24518/g.81505 Transcript_24518/m.81505 type:complete len:125 (-) Transcript_24518:572-946(-)
MRLPLHLLCPPSQLGTLPLDGRLELGGDGRVRAGGGLELRLEMLPLHFELPTGAVRGTVPGGGRRRSAAAAARGSPVRSSEYSCTTASCSSSSRRCFISSAAASTCPRESPRASGARPPASPPG